MNQSGKNRILIWIIIILAATNISTIGSFYYHRISELKDVEVSQDEQTVVPGEQRTRFFRDELNLDANQLDQFRDINRTFNHTGRDIEMSLEKLREDLINELGAPETDRSKLDRLAAEIGEDHRKLKEVTSTFYLNMKAICTPEQQIKLNQIFKSMLNKDSQVNLPHQGNGKGRGRWRNR
ncbi:MAG: periplasmic heavy metal sensor [Prolixibacteraceae bacterium]|jgi:Spy/CpxP family protein refolding chaperone